MKILDIDVLAEELKEIISEESKILKNEPMKNQTSFKIGGPADIFVKARKQEDILKVINFSKSQKIPLTIVGNGSDLLVRDGGIRGIVLKIDLCDFEVEKLGEAENKIKLKTISPKELIEKDKIDVINKAELEVQKIKNQKNKFLDKLQEEKPENQNENSKNQEENSKNQESKVKDENEKIQQEFDSETKEKIQDFDEKIKNSEEKLENIKKNIKKISEQNLYLVKLGAGMKNGFAGQKILIEDLEGFEFAAGIPGCIGGAIRQNAGAHGGEMKDIVVETTCMDYSGKIFVFSNEEQQFEYRNSIFKSNKYIILNTIIKLHKGNYTEIRDRIWQYKTWRETHQPHRSPSAGSTFKRGDGFITAMLIDQCGLKGYHVGGAEVSTKHAGFVVNTGNATAKDVIAVVEHIKSEVYKKFGKTIELEIHIIGED